MTDPTYPDDMPDPTKTYEDFLVQLMACKTITNLSHYKIKGGKNSRLWMATAGQHFHNALQDGIVTVDLIETNGERMNSYYPTDGARVFWKNAAEENHPPGKVLEGWRAMQSILNDATAKE